MDNYKVSKNHTVTISIDREYVAHKIEKVLRKWHLDISLCEEDFQLLLKECVEDL
jgi:hypothetical protein